LETVKHENRTKGIVSMKLRIAVVFVALGLAGAARAAGAPSTPNASRDGDVVSLAVSAPAGAPDSVPAGVARRGIGDAERWAEIGAPAPAGGEAPFTTTLSRDLGRAEQLGEEGRGG
jgi:hypothetical protein